METQTIKELMTNDFDGELIKILSDEFAIGKYTLTTGKLASFSHVFCVIDGKLFQFCSNHKANNIQFYNDVILKLNDHTVRCWNMNDFSVETEKVDNRDHKARWSRYINLIKKS